MKTNNPGCYLRVAFLVFVCGCSAVVAHAEDVVPARAQSDAQISVWANNAPLELFISQLAGMTGRRVAIEGTLDGQVSGRFNGTMIDTLNAVREQHQMLFDLDQKVLGVVADSERSSATIALGGSSIDDVLPTSLSSVSLEGNEIQLREGEVVVSGHPEFVQRVAKLVTTSIADAGQKSDIQRATDEPSLSAEVPVDPVAEVSADSATDVPVDAVAEAPAEVAAALPPPEADTAFEPVADAAASVILEQAAEESLSGDASDTAASSPQPILWVTDIPGYETF